MGPNDARTRMRPTSIRRSTRKTSAARFVCTAVCEVRQKRSFVTLFVTFRRRAPASVTAEIKANPSRGGTAKPTRLTFEGGSDEPNERRDDSTNNPCPVSASARGGARARRIHCPRAGDDGNAEGDGRLGKLKSCSPYCPEGEEDRMKSSGLVRWGALGLFLGGTVWLLLGLISLFDGLLATPGRKDDVVLLALGLVLTAAGLVGPHALQKESYGLLGRAGFYIAVASLLARALRDVIFLAGGQTLLQWIVWPSVWGMMVGLA